MAKGNAGPSVRTAFAALQNKTGSNAGHVLAKCVPTIDEKGRKKTLDAARVALRSSQPLYKMAFDRWRVATAGFTGAEFRTSGRLIVGLGRDSVLETGVTLHHTYGVPVIPGSALKGLCSHYCDEVWGEENRSFRMGQPVWNLLFGTTTECGFVSFLDGWMLPGDLTGSKTGLLLDVMTPHHQDWPRDTKNPPLDTDDPVPVSFLSVAGTFRVVIDVDAEGEERERIQQMAMRLLEQSLANWGIGGKTSSGYGRMRQLH